MMKHPLILFLLLLVGCATPPAEPARPGAEPIPVNPPPAPPAPDAARLIDALSHRLVAAPAFASLAAPVAQPMQTLTLGLLSIDVVGHYGVQACDSGWLVQAAADGSTRVLAVRAARGSVSWALNVPGDNSADLHGRSTSLPLVVGPCDKLVLLGSASDRPTLGFASAGGAVAEAAAIAFVRYEVRQSIAGQLLRPPAWGRRGPITDFLAEFPWPVAWIDWARLPAVVDVAACAAEAAPGWDANSRTPTFDAMLAMHRGFACDGFSDWRCAGRVPHTAHQGYGTFVAAGVSNALMLCVSTAPLEPRRQLALALCQRAIDDLGGLADGSWRYPLGGHCWGRRGPLVLLGHLFSIDIFANPAEVLGDRMPEDQLVATTAWWGEAGWVGYLFSLQTPVDIWSRPPSTWGDPQAADHGTFGWQVAYGGQVFPAMVGTATAIVVMGRERSAPKLVQAVRCWMKGPPAAARAQLQAAGIADLNFGGDYGTQRGFAAAAWRRYAQ